ncbi:hypothetical protein [Pseudonocardia alni]|uniref:hypothetical protein n=1 Tax=Pseudonocardia alni TaxID=33907 RepID=UPI003D9E43F9
MATYIREARKAAGMDWPVTSHTFRKTATTIWHDSGILTDRQKADLTGHAKISTLTDIYVARGELHPAGAAVMDALMAPGRLSRVLFATAEVPPPDLRQAEQLVEFLWSDYQRGRIAEVVDRLPRLIRTAQQLEDGARDVGDDARRRSWAASARTHHLAATTLSKVGEADLSWIAAERAMKAADEADDPLVLASAARAATHALLAVGRSDDALGLGETAARWLVLRRAELAGLDPHAVLADAVDRGPLTGSRNLTNVLYSRIRDAHRFDPVGDTWTEWTPRTDNTEWSDYLTALATAADDRAATLGRDAAADPPVWATSVFGDCPAEADQRDEWCAAVGRVAAYREMRGHASDDGDDVLGPAPKPGQVEEFAAYRAAWRTLGRPEIDREHLELSNGQLRARVRAYERELAAAPRYVANELAGTRQAAATQQQTAALRRAEADAVTDPSERQRILDESTQAAALAAVLDARAEHLQQIDDARASWLAHTAQTRVQAELSKAELSARDADDDPDQQVTAAEWKIAHDAAMAGEDAHREITEADLAVDDDLDDPRPVRGDAAAGTGWDDVREQVEREPRPGREDIVRVPDAAETTDHLDHAGRILDEIRYRDTGDDLARAEELNRWHTDDQAATVENDAADAPVDEYGNGW